MSNSTNTAPEKFADVASLVAQAQPLLNAEQIKALKQKAGGLNRLSLELLKWLQGRGGRATVDEAVSVFPNLSVRELLYLCISHIDMVASGPQAGPDGTRLGLDREAIELGILQTSDGIGEYIQQLTVLEPLEAARLIVMLDLVCQLGGLPPDRHLLSLYQKLAILVGKEQVGEQSSNRVTFSTKEGTQTAASWVATRALVQLSARPQQVEKNLELIKQAHGSSRVLQFVYVDAADQVTTRRALVNDWKREGGNDVVSAYDLDKDAQRTFLLQRMSNLTLTQQRLDPVTLKKEGKRGGFQVVLRISKEAKWLTEASNTHLLQRVRGGYRVRVHVWSQAALEDLICRLGSHLLELKGPRQALDSVTERAQLALRLYQSPDKG